jgi:integrase
MKLTESLSLVPSPAVEVFEGEALTEEEFQALQLRAAQVDPRLAAMMSLFAKVTGQAVTDALRAAGVGEDTPRLSATERAQQWPIAWAEWLATDYRKGGRARPANTTSAYADAWEDFRQFIAPRCAEWAVTGEIVAAWLGELATRTLQPAVARGLEANGRRTAGQIGLSPAGIQQRLAAVSSFYSFAERYDVITLDGRTVRLFDGPNPCKATVVKRPTVCHDEKSIDLSLDQVRKLLHTIRRDTSLTGIRNYALIKCYIYTGGRNLEIRTLRWQDIRHRGSRVYYYKDNKGKSGWRELARPAYTAIESYLKLSGRWATMQPGDYIFQPASACVTRLQGKPAAGDDPQSAFDLNRPISASEVNRILRRYATLAELPNVARIHVHCLRHTAAMLYAEECDGDVQDIQSLLDHSNLGTTGIYLEHRRGKRNNLWSRLEEKLDGAGSDDFSRPDPDPAEQPALIPGAGRKPRLPRRRSRVTRPASEQDG